MKHNEKLKNIRKAQNLTIEELYKRGITILGPQKAISISTINRIEAGKPHKFSSLLKLCFILGIELKDLYKGTELEECLVIGRKDRTGGYVYNKKASSQIINSPNQSFLVLEVALLPSGKIPLDHAPASKEKHGKVIYVVRGQLDCIVDDQRYSLKGGETISFNSEQPHYFENNSKKKCIFTMTESPGRY